MLYNVSNYQYDGIFTLGQTEGANFVKIPKMMGFQHVKNSLEKCEGYCYFFGSTISTNDLGNICA